MENITNSWIEVRQWFHKDPKLTFSDIYVLFIHLLCGAREDLGLKCAF